MFEEGLRSNFAKNISRQNKLIQIKYTLYWYVYDFQVNYKPAVI